MRFRTSRTTTTASAVLVAALALSLAAAPARSAPEDGAPPAAGNDSPPVAETAEAVLAALQAEYKEASKAYGAALREHRAAGADAQGPAPVRVEPEFVKRYAAAAERFAGTAGAAPFLIQVASLGQRHDRPAGKAALEQLVARHADHPQLAQLTFTLVYGAHYWSEDFVRDVMSKFADASPHADVRAAMLYARGVLVSRRGPKGDEERLGALADLRAAIEAGPETRYGDLSKGVIYELENLQIGMTAPDIEGADLDGVVFRLADYRGKVVVLDFWGDW